MDFNNLKRFMDNMALTRTPGNAVEVYLNGKSVFRYEAGYSDLESKTPLNGKEMYNIYSCSKIATVVAGAQLLERGDFLLNEPLYAYIPEFKHMYVKDTTGNLKEAENPITIGDLFSMTAGFTYDFNSHGFQKARELTKGKMDTVETIKCVAADPLSFEPGSHWQYSICHDVLAALVSVISGKKFRNYVKDNIFDPLEMNESVYHQTKKTLERTAQQYCFVSAEKAVQSIVESQMHGNANTGFFRNEGKQNQHILGEEYDSGGAGIITTVSDYAKLMAALANYGTGVNGERILSKYTVNLMRTNRLTTQQQSDFSWKQLAGCGYGLGVRTHTLPEKSGLICSPGEFGWGGAAGATAIVDPEINLGVFYVQHTLNPREEYYQPRLRNIIYSCL